MKRKPEDIYLREEDDVQYLLGKTPGSLLRYGISIAFAAAVLAVAAAWIIRYPDVVVAPVMIAGERPAVRLVSVSGGNISTINVEDKSTVIAGQLLLTVENPAKWEDVIALESWLSRFPEDTLAPENGRVLDLGENPPAQSALGALQSSFSAWTEEWNQLRFRMEKDYAGRQIVALNQQINSLDQLNTGLKQQEETAVKEADLAAGRLSKSEQLFKSGAISELDLERDQTAYLSRRRQVETLQAEQWNNRLRSDELRRKQLELRQGHRENLYSANTRLREQTRKLRSEIQSWKQQFLVTAPADGIVSLSLEWTPGQYLRPGQEVMTLVSPEGEGALKAQGLLPIIGAGKVAVGMDARIRLAGFPYKEYGVLEGTVQDISLAPVEAGEGGPAYRIEIALPQGLRTDYGRELPLLREAQGTARIITEQRSLLERLFEPLYSAWKNN
jgi:multidrug resistance efflux pump